MNLSDFIVLVTCQLNWTAIAVLLNAIVFAVGFSLALKEFRLNRRSRDAEDRISISQNTFSHNELVVKDKLARSVVATLEGLNVPQDDEDELIYWKYRAVHLSHINLIWRVWDLGGRPGAGKGFEKDLDFDGWQRFAQKIVARKLKAAADAVNSGSSTPELLAGADVWKGLAEYESPPKKLADWLRWLAENDTA